MRKFKDWFNKNKKRNLLLTGIISCCLVCGAVTFGYFIINSSDTQNTTISSKNVTANEQKTEEKDSKTLAGLSSNDKKESKASSKSSETSGSSKSSSQSGSQQSSGSSSSQAQSTCNHNWCYFEHGDICDKCRAERTHTHNWVVYARQSAVKKSISVYVCHKCGTHYQQSGCPSCGSYSYSSGMDYLMDTRCYVRCSTCGKDGENYWEGNEWMDYCTCAVD